MNTDPSSQRWSQVVSKSWSDAAFRKRLVAEPMIVLKEQGINVPPGVQVKVVEDTPTLCHLTLPAKPNHARSEAELEAVSGGIIAVLIGRSGESGGSGIKDGSSN